jgi:CBS domain-containing protein/sporulation protein YlmC with PRC-barrel domain
MMCMENLSGSTVSDLVVETVDTITPDESVAAARRRMESQTSRSLIVVEADRPVGIVQWRGLGQLDGDTAVRSVMATDIPILRTDMTVNEVRDYLAGRDVDFDHLPVVNESGTLIGEVPRRAVTKGEFATESATGDAIGGAEADRSDVISVHLEKGMTVVGVSGKKLGTVEAVEVSGEGHVAHFTVKHGLLGNHHKRLPSDVIGGVEGDTVTLNIDKQEFGMLADVGDAV